MSIIDVAYALTTPVEAFANFMLFDTFFEKRRNFARWQYVAGWLLLTVLFRVTNILFLFRLGNAVGLILSALLVSFIFYRTSWRKRIFVIMFATVSIIVIEIFVWLSVSLIFDLSANEALDIPSFLILSIVLSKALLLAVCYAARVKQQNKQFEVERSYWLLFVSLFSISVVSTFLILGMMQAIDDNRYNGMALICSIGLFAGTFLSLYFYERSQRQHQIIRHQEQSEQQMRGQLKHMDEIILKQNELRAMRHDMNAHLTALKGLLDSGALAESRDYVSALVDQFQQVAPAVNTGNNALDAILSAKQSLAESKGIAFRTHLRIQERLPIAPEDLAIIFGNALDNAIEACDRLPEGAEKRITLVLQQDATMLLCRITNTAPEKKNALLATSKADKANHGFGVQNIREALDKYEATVTFSQEGTLFHFSFMLFY